MPTIPSLSSIARLAEQTTVWFVDIWGVMHNGVQPFPQAVAACCKFREGGGKVVLVSNSPRRRDGVIRQLDQIGVHRGAYDDCVTSGDVSRHLIAALKGQTIYHIGPERDLAIFEGLGVHRGAAQDAAAIVCTGLFDDVHETPVSYAGPLQDFKTRHLPMICANPDKTVLRGGKLIYCAGAVAAAYEALGGDVHYAGKPYLPIYEAASACAARFLGATPDRSQILAIGDGIATDIRGASNAGLRSLFIAGGLHVAAHEDLSDAVEDLFQNEPAKPLGAMRELAWVP